MITLLSLGIIIAEDLDNSRDRSNIGTTTSGSFCNLLITEASDAMAAYGAARIAYLGFNNINHDNVLSPPKVKTVIEKDHKLSQMLIDRFSKWKNFYVS